jgi:D-psicose/D-tagatose/L-ribulose 3-epimerase
MKLSMIHWMRSEPLEQTVARLAATGYDGIEINGEPELYDTEEVRACLERHGIALWGAVTLMEHGGRDMVHPDRYVRLGTQRYLEETIELIADLGGQVLCCVPSTIGKTQPLAPASIEWQWCVDGLRAAGQYAGERDVKIALEPISRFETYLLNRADQALAMVADVDLPNVGVCLDAFHMNMEEQAPLEAIRSVGSKMFDFHVADSNRRPPGQGTIRWREILDALDEIGYVGHLTAEVDPPRDRSPLAAVPEEDGEFASSFYDEVVAATPRYLRSVRADQAPVEVDSED